MYTIERNDDDPAMDFDCGPDQEAIIAALLARNEGRNLKCWPVCSFDWKDADLLPDGCTGIKSIELVDGKQYTLTAVFGGHKTVCPDEDSDDDEANEALQTSVMDCGLNAEWTGDDWSLSLEDTITLNLDEYMNETGDDLDHERIADAVIEQANEVLDDFRKATRELDR